MTADLIAKLEAAGGVSSPSGAVTWLEQAATSFEEQAAKSSEDSAYWANVYNAKNARRIADLIRALSTQPVSGEVANG